MTRPGLSRILRIGDLTTGGHGRIMGKTVKGNFAAVRETVESQFETDDTGSPFPAFKQSPAYQAQLFARIAQNDYMARISDTGIAPAQAYVLGELWFAEPLSQVELARRLEIGKATVGQTLTRLERAGVIERRRAANDRRVVMVHLTDKGRAMRGPLRAATLAQNAMLEERLGKERIEQLTELLTIANEQLIGSFPRPVDD